MKKQYLHVAILIALGTGLYGCQITTPYNPYSVEPYRWEKQIDSEEIQFQDRFIPTYGKRRGERQIVAVERFEFRFVNKTNQYQCATLSIDDKYRTDTEEPHFTTALHLIAPKQTTYIGAYSPYENNDGFSIHYRMRKGEVVQSGKDYRCNEIKKIDGCYITTAMCRDTGKADDCDELQTLRKYRDEVMLHDELGRELVKEYYLKAPKIVEKIDQQTNHQDIYRHLRQHYIEPAAQAAKVGENERALQLYKNMVESLAEQYL